MSKTDETVSKFIESQNKRETDALKLQVKNSRVGLIQAIGIIATLLILLIQWAK